MRTRQMLLPVLADQRGVTVIVVALTLLTLTGFAALAIDLSHLYVVSNELKNAADAGALAGTRFLFNEDGSINTGANKIAYDAAVANMSYNMPVEVNDYSSNNGDVQRGHWSFTTRTFTPNSSTSQANLGNRSFLDLDQDTSLINAVRVVARRQSNTAPSYFARIFGYEGFGLVRESIAYLGFAGTIEPFGVDLPIAICEQAIVQSGAYTCSVGRMISSGNVVSNHETGGWTDFNQEDSPCEGGTNAHLVKNLISAGGNPNVIKMGKHMATNGGAIEAAFSELYSRWQKETNSQRPWQVTLPVVECPSNNMGTCQKMVGAVTVNIIWINDQNDPLYKNVPTKMAAVPPLYSSWQASGKDKKGQKIWQSFQEHYNLLDVDGSPAAYEQKTIYFLPECEPKTPVGTTGGNPYGVLAEIPVLVN